MSLKNSILHFIEREIFNVLLAAEICDEDKSAKLAADIMHSVQKTWGGCRVYVPKLTYTYEDIKAEFNGKNHVKVLRKFDISLKTLYTALKS